MSKTIVSSDLLASGFVMRDYWDCLCPADYIQARWIVSKCDLCGAESHNRPDSLQGPVIQSLIVSDRLRLETVNFFAKANQR